MKFGEFPVYDALGVELALPIKYRGKTLPKGHIITSEDVALLRAEGIKTVVGAVYSADDIHPETASEILMKAIAGDYIRYTFPDEDGYCEIYADNDGILIFDVDRMIRFNGHSENISLAIMAPYVTVYKGQFLGNLRLFGLALDADELNEGVGKITGIGPLIKISPYAFKKMAYIQTVLDPDKIPKIDQNEINQRFIIYGYNLIFADICAHTSEGVEKSVRNAIDAGAEVVLVESPLAPLHRNDVVPKGFIESSADIDHMGWPMDSVLPMVFAHRKEVQLIGYSASDAKTPAFDRLMRFLATNSLPPIETFPVLGIASLSLERLVKQITPEQMKHSVAVGISTETEKTAVLILAAGTSRRMVGTNKLLEFIDGIPMIERAVQSALLSKAEYVAVVTGHNSRQLEKRLEKYDVKIVRNPDYSSGVLGSIRIGLAVLPPDIMSAVVLPADMPAFAAEYIDMLIDAFDAKADRKPVCVPTYKGVRHNPVLWPRDLFNVVKLVPEDSQWMPALIEHSDYIKELPLDDDLPITDINTWGDLSNYLSRIGAKQSIQDDFSALEKHLDILSNPDEEVIPDTQEDHTAEVNEAEEQARKALIEKENSLDSLNNPGAEEIQKSKQKTKTPKAKKDDTEESTQLSDDEISEAERDLLALEEMFGKNS